MNRLLPIFAIVAALVSGCATLRLVDRADSAVDEQRFVDAVGLYEQALEKRPNDAALRAKLETAKRAGAAHHHLEGRKAEQTNELNRAVQELELALVLQADLEAARTDRSRVARQLEVVRRAVRKATDAAERGDCLTARSAFEALTKYSKTFPEITTGRDTATRSCFDKALAVARQFRSLGAEDAAARYIAEADGLLPGQTEVSRLRGDADASVRAESLVSQAQISLIRGDFEEAVASFEKALQAMPGHAEAVRGRAAASSRGVDELVASAQKDLAKGRRQTALVALERAANLAVADPALQTSIRASSSDLRKQLAARLYKRGGRAEAEQLFGAAWAWYRVADLVGGGIGDSRTRAGTSLERVNQAVPYRILIMPPAHASVFPDLGREIAHDLTGALTPLLAKTKVSLTLDPAEEPPPDGILRGRLSAFAIDAQPVNQFTEEVSVRLPDRLTTNPAAGAALKAYVEAVMSKDPTATANALKALRETPKVVVEAGEERRVVRPAATGKVRARISAELELYDRANDKVVTAAYADSEFTVEDKGTPALAAADRAADPLVLPSTLAMRRRLVVDATDQLVDQLGPALSLAGSRFVKLADRVKGDARLHFLVLALIAGAPEPETLKTELLGTTGYVFGEDRVDIVKVPY